jgi:hypothetical protein
MPGFSPTSETVIADELDNAGEDALVIVDKVVHDDPLSEVHETVQLSTT